jgi:hypothetical protein
MDIEYRSLFFEYCYFKTRELMAKLDLYSPPAVLFIPVCISGYWLTPPYEVQFIPVTYFAGAVGVPVDVILNLVEKICLLL